MLGGFGVDVLLPVGMPTKDQRREEEAEIDWKRTSLFCCSAGIE